jgi:hypothetical protein
MRFGELLGLKWEDVNFSGNVIEIQRSFSHGHMDTPKSKKSRFVDISNQLKLTLLQHQGAMRKKFKGTLPEAIFPDTQGGHQNGDNVRHRVFAPLIEKLNMARFRIHDIRHTLPEAYRAQVIGVGAHFVRSLRLDVHGRTGHCNNGTGVALPAPPAAAAAPRQAPGSPNTPGRRCRRRAVLVASSSMYTADKCFAMRANGSRAVALDSLVTARHPLAPGENEGFGSGLSVPVLWMWDHGKEHPAGATLSDGQERIAERNGVIGKRHDEQLVWRAAENQFAEVQHGGSAVLLQLRFDLPYRPRHVQEVGWSFRGIRPFDFAYTDIEEQFVQAEVCAVGIVVLREDAAPLTRVLSLEVVRQRLHPRL